MHGFVLFCFVFVGKQDGPETSLNGGLMWEVLFLTCIYGWVLTLFCLGLWCEQGCVNNKLLIIWIKCKLTGQLKKK